MALSRLLVFVLIAALPLLLTRTEAGELGVNYGRLADNLPDPATVSKLLQDNNITMVRIYDANPDVLRSLADTGIKVTVMVPNEDLADVAGNPSVALDWVRNNVAAYLPATKIHGVAVGNEVFVLRPDLTMQLVPAIKNVQAALEQLRLAVEISTPISFSAVNVSFPPSAGRFQEDLAQSVMKPMLDLLQQSGSYLTMNIFPFFAFNDPESKINPDYAMGNPNSTGVLDPVTGNVYYSLLDAKLDATYYAIEKLGFSGSSESNKLPVKLCVTEVGWPSRGHVKKGKHMEAQIGSEAATPANAQAYINNLINRMLSGNTGTPHHPDADMDVYIFALFNENLKGQGPDDVEQHFGLFYPNMTKVYEFDFRGGMTKRRWCVANASVGDARLQAALDYACTNGADCSAILPGGSCFEPNTMVAHASYALNSYYQHRHRATGTCDFARAARVVYHQPKYGNCVLPSKAKIKETRTVSEGYAAV